MSKVTQTRISAATESAVIPVRCSNPMCLSGSLCNGDSHFCAALQVDPRTDRGGFVLANVEQLADWDARHCADTMGIKRGCAITGTDAGQSRDHHKWPGVAINEQNW